MKDKSTKRIHMRLWVVLGLFGSGNSNPVQDYLQQELSKFLKTDRTQFETSTSLLLPIGSSFEPTPAEWHPKESGQPIQGHSPGSRRKKAAPKGCKDCQERDARNDGRSESTELITSTRVDGSQVADLVREENVPPYALNCPGEKIEDHSLCIDKTFMDWIIKQEEAPFKNMPDFDVGIIYDAVSESFEPFTPPLFQNVSKICLTESLNLANVLDRLPIPLYVPSLKGGVSRFQDADMIRNLLVSCNANISPTLRVGVSVKFVKISSIELETGEFTVSCWIRLFWTDPRVLYDGTSFIPQWDSSTDYIPLNVNQPGDQDIWVPYLTLINNMRADLQETLNYFFTLSLFDKHFLRAKGYNVYWGRQIVLKGLCPPYVSMFPFDIQYCPFDFQVYGLNEQRFSYGFTNGGYPPLVEVAFPTESEVWAVAHTAVHPMSEEMNNKISDVRYLVILARDPDYYVSNFVWPLALVTLFGYLSFWLPFEMYDRVALSVTILLAIFAIMFITASERPPLGRDTWLDVYQAGCIALCMIPAVETIIVSRMREQLHRRNLQKEAEWKRMKAILHMNGITVRDSTGIIANPLLSNPTDTFRRPSAFDSSNGGGNNVLTQGSGGLPDRRFGLEVGRSRIEPGKRLSADRRASASASNGQIDVGQLDGSRHNSHISKRSASAIIEDGGPPLAEIVIPRWADQQPEPDERSDPVDLTAAGAEALAPLLGAIVGPAGVWPQVRPVLPYESNYPTPATVDGIDSITRPFQSDLENSELRNDFGHIFMTPDQRYGRLPDSSSSESHPSWKPGEDAAPFSSNEYPLTPSTNDRARASAHSDVHPSSPDEIPPVQRNITHNTPSRAREVPYSAMPPVKAGIAKFSGRSPERPPRGNSPPRSPSIRFAAVDMVEDVPMDHRVWRVRSDDTYDRGSRSPRSRSDLSGGSKGSRSGSASPRSHRVGSVRSGGGMPPRRFGRYTVRRHSTSTRRGSATHGRSSGQNSTGHRSTALSSSVTSAPQRLEAGVRFQHISSSTSSRLQEGAGLKRVCFGGEEDGPSSESFHWDGLLERQADGTRGEGMRQEMHRFEHCDSLQPKRRRGITRTKTGALRRLKTFKAELKKAQEVSSKHFTRSLDLMLHQQDVQRQWRPTNRDYVFGSNGRGNGSITGPSTRGSKSHRRFDGVSVSDNLSSVTKQPQSPWAGLGASGLGSANGGYGGSVSTGVARFGYEDESKSFFRRDESSQEPDPILEEESISQSGPIDLNATPIVSQYFSKPQLEDPATLPNFIDRLFQIVYPGFMLTFFIERMAMTNINQRSRLIGKNRISVQIFFVFLVSCLYLLWIFAIASHLMVAFPISRNHVGYLLAEAINSKLAKARKIKYSSTRSGPIPFSSQPYTTSNSPPQPYGPQSYGQSTYIPQSYGGQQYNPPPNGTNGAGPYVHAGGPFAVPTHFSPSARQNSGVPLSRPQLLQGGSSHSQINGKLHWNEQNDHISAVF